MHRTAVSDDDRSTMQRMLSLIAAVGEGGRGVSLARLVSVTGLPKSTVHRLVGKLVEYGLLRKSDAGYQLGLLLLEFGRHVPEEHGLRVRALPFMLDLYAATKQVVFLGVLDRNQVLYIESLAGQNSRIPPATGFRQAPHTTAIGKTLVAHTDDEIEPLLSSRLTARTRHTIVVPSVMETELNRVRDEGMAYDREECLLGMHCASVPIVDPEGRCIAAIALATTNPDDLARLSSAVRSTAVGISRAVARNDPIPYEQELGLSANAVPPPGRIVERVLRDVVREHERERRYG
jgi:IclR family transcriptional regulator, acetate operon repressor